MRSSMRVSFAAGLLVASALSGCTPERIKIESVSTIRIDHLGNSFRTIAGYDQTFAWDQPELEAGGLA